MKLIIVVICLVFFIPLDSVGQKDIKILPLNYKGIKLNYNFKNVLPRVVREYNDHYFVATDNAIIEFSKDGSLLSKLNLPKQINYVIGFYKSHNGDFIYIAQYTRLFVLTPNGKVKKVFTIGENFDYLPEHGFFNYFIHYDSSNLDSYMVRCIDETLKERLFKLSHGYVNGMFNISHSFIYGIESNDDGTDRIISYKLPEFKDRKIYYLTKQFPTFYYWSFVGMVKNKAFFFSSNGNRGSDTLKVVNFDSKEISNYKFNFKQPKLKLQKFDKEEIGYTHPKGHFIDLMDDKLLVLSNTVEGSFIYEVEY